MTNKKTNAILLVLALVVLSLGVSERLGSDDTLAEEHGEDEMPTGEYEMIELGEQDAINLVESMLEQIDDNIALDDVAAARMTWHDFELLHQQPGTQYPVHDSSLDDDTPVWVVAFKTMYPLEQSSDPVFGPDQGLPLDPETGEPVVTYLDSSASDWFHSPEDGTTTGFYVLDPFNSTVFAQGLHGPFFPIDYFDEVSNFGSP